MQGPKSGLLGIEQPGAPSNPYEFLCKLSYDKLYGPWLKTMQYNWYLSWLGLPGIVLDHIVGLLCVIHNCTTV